MRKHIFLLMLLVPIVLSGLDLSSIDFTYLSKEDGLSDNNVECIFKDSDGFMWFGTRNGLCRYDGYDVKIFRTSVGENSISGNRILDVVEDKDGYLWIATFNHGLNRYDKKKGEFLNFGTEIILNERINKVKKFRDNSIWVCSGYGLYCITQGGDSIKAYLPDWASDTSLNSGIIYDILETSTGDIYVATEHNNIQKLDRSTGSFTSLSYERNTFSGSNYRKSLLEDSEGKIWITASHHGLSCYDPISGDSQNFNEENKGLSTNVLIGDMALDKDGNIWICTEEDGINIFNTTTFAFQHIVKNKDLSGSINSDHTYSIYFDEDNIAWIGTFDKGLNIYNPHQKKFGSSLFEVNDLHLLEGHSVLDIFEDSNGKIWIGTDGYGLFQYEKNKPVKHYLKSGTEIVLNSNVITALGEDRLGNILIGTYSGGFSTYNPDTGKSQNFQPDGSEKAITSPHVWEIFNDSENRIWLGMLATGAMQYVQNTQEFIDIGPLSKSSRKIDFYNVMVIQEDSDGDLWFGTEGRGIFLLDKETDRVLRLAIDSTTNFSTVGIIKCIKEDQWGNIWIGTEDHGLFKYDKNNNKSERYNKSDGFTSGPIQSISDDLLGNVWIGTSYGLYQFNPKENKFSHFITADGISSNDFNPDAMASLSDGRILVGTNNGVDLISSAAIVLNMKLPKVVLTKLSVLNHDIAPGTVFNNRQILSHSITYTDTLDILWTDKSFSIEFAALNYTLPDKCLYKYKLEGFDQDWIINTADRRVAHYSNLEPGEYHFKVMASNNDGHWGDNEISLKINVKPPFWDTLVFKLLLTLLLSIIIYYLYRVRINQHKELFKKEQLETERKIVVLENEKLEAELKKLAFSVISKNKLLLEQKNRILILANKAKVTVKEGLLKIVDIIDEDLDEEKDWKFIEPQIDKAYNQFISKLREKHSDLSATEIRISAYIRMNLSTKEICEFMNKTQRAVENDRYRLRKKIGLSTNDSIQNYLLNI